MDVLISRQPQSEALYNDYMEDRPRIRVLAKHKRVHASNLARLAYPDANRVSLLSGGFGDFCFIPQDFYWYYTRPFVIRTPTDKIIPFFKFPEDIQLLIMEQWVQPFRARVEDNSIVVTLREILGRRCHPFRNGYQIEVPDTDGRCRSRIFNHNYIHSLNEDEYEVIRALSQTSHQMRKLLQQVFWKDVYLNIGRQDDGYGLLDLLQDRPAICGSIKKLRMAWGCGDLDREIIPLCQYISSQLELDELSVNFSSINRSQVHEMLANNDALWVQAFRKMKFKKLKIDLWIEEVMDPENYYDSEDDQDMHEYEDDYDSEDLSPENIDPNDEQARNLAERRRKIAERKKWSEENLAGLTEKVERHLRSTEMGEPGEVEKYLASRVTEQES